MELTYREISLILSSIAPIQRSAKENAMMKRRRYGFRVHYLRKWTRISNLKRKLIEQMHFQSIKHLM